MRFGRGPRPLVFPLLHRSHEWIGEFYISLLRKFIATDEEAWNLGKCPQSQSKTSEKLRELRSLPTSLIFLAINAQLRASRFSLMSSMSLDDGARRPVSLVDDVADFNNRFEGGCGI